MNKSDTEANNQLTNDERDLFERLADKFEDEEVGRIAELVLQSSPSEEANS